MFFSSFIERSSGKLKKQIKISRIANILSILCLPLRFFESSCGFLKTLKVIKVLKSSFSLLHADCAGNFFVVIAQYF